MRLSTLAASAAIAALLCSGCTVIQGITDSDGSSGPEIQDATASHKKADQGAASRGKVNGKALESRKASKDQSQSRKDSESSESAKAGDGKSGDAKASPESAPAAAKPASPAPDADEEAALRNTEVTDADLAAESGAGAKDAAAGGSGEKSKDGMDNASPSALPPVDEETAQQISDLPDYATASGRQTCPASLGQSAQSAAAELAKALSANLNIDKGAVFCAPTVIPDEYSDCVQDVSATVASGLAASGKFDMADSGRVQVAQNSGSSMLIPAYVRECRRSSIPYLAVTVVRRIGGKVSLTLRIIRADTGVTLTQSYRRL